jgi:uncharacterized membrane protein
MTLMSKQVVGIYENGEDAVKVVEELLIQGYKREEISVVAKDRKETKVVERKTGTKAEEGLATGAATGGVIGGTAGLLAGAGALAIPGIGPLLAAGPIVSALAGVAVGAGTGGLAGTLIGLGISEKEAESYETDIKAGKVLILVDNDIKKGPSTYIR